VASSVFNIAKGRAVELHAMAIGGGPTSACLVVAAISATGLETDAVLLDKVTLADVVAGTTNLAANTTVQVVDTPIPSSPDDTNNWIRLDLTDVNFGAVIAGDPWAKVVIGFNPTLATAATNHASTIPISLHDIAITPDGSTIIIQINALGYFQANECP